MEENKNSAISVRNVCIDYKSLKTGSIKQNFFKLKKVEQEVFHALLRGKLPVLPFLI